MPTHDALLHSPPDADLPSAAVRTMVAGAVAWSLGFAALNLWVQYVAIDPGHALADHRVGLAVLNAVAIALKLAGVAMAVAAVRSPRPTRTGPLTALLTAAVVTLGLWGVAGLVVLGATGALVGPQALAGGAMVIPGWTYPTFFLLGALAFSGPMRHVRRLGPAPRRWMIIGGLVGPPLVMGTIYGAAQMLVVTGLLPPL